MNITVTTTTVIGVTVEQPGIVIYVAAIIGVAGTILGVVLGQRMQRRALIESISFQREERRRERHSEAIYRPLLGQVNRIRDQIFAGESPDLDGLERTMQDGMFYVMDEEVKKHAIAFFVAVKLYKDSVEISGARGATIEREEIARLLRDWEEDLSRYRRGGLELAYRAFIDNLSMGTVSLGDCILIDKTPLQILRERIVSAKEARIDSNIGGEPVSRELADKISESVLDKARGDSDITATRMLRENILRNIVLPELLEKLL